MIKKLLGTALCIFLILVAAIFVDSYSEKNIKAEYAIVYGNKVELNGQPSKRLEARLLAALELYKNGTTEKIITSGGVGREGHDEAKVMAQFLLGKGVSSTAVIVDSEGYSTHLTSKSAKQLIADKSASIIAVSQQYHVSRAKLSLRNAGFINVYGYFPSYHEPRDVYAYIREVAAWGKYWIYCL